MLVVATYNEHKVREIYEILHEAIPALGADELVSAARFGQIDVVEDGASFAENATLKARTIARVTGLPAVADDSGICVDVMGGAPGIFSARWSGKHGADEDNLRLLLAQMAEIPDALRTAKFVCAAAIARPDGDSSVVIGELAGTLARAPRGAYGFGYDPIFIPLGRDQTTAELAPEEKNAISHRREAFFKLAPLVAAMLGK